ncbi:MAG: protein kinase [Myxococcales bacterium]|nr:protein kinase [Myxococcales bacterium]
MSQDEPRDPDATVGMTPWSAASESGERVVLGGRYEILGLLGAGGMGSVYRAFDRELEETVALKTLRSDVVATPRLLERFRREVKLARRVTHPNVARTFDIGEHGSERFLTMEYVEGESLSALLGREGSLAPARVTSIALEVCAGLAAAHAVGVVHRDLKPENVLLDKKGRVVLTDFGIACAREDEADTQKTLGGVVGTPAYMAPEQVEALPDVDARADIYALGVLLFEMLTGAMPFSGNSAYAVASARLTSDGPDPRRERADLPEALCRVVRRCMARQRDSRYGNVAQLAAELSSAAPTQIDELSVSRPSGAWQPPNPSTQTRPGEKTLAVLPFRNAGPTEDDYLAEGLTEDLIDTLSMTPGLKIRPRASVLPYKNAETDPREVGQRLGVQVVVDGSVRRAGAALRVSTRLIGVSDGFQLWAKRFDRPQADALVVSDEAAHAIAEALSVDPAAPLRAAPSDPSAIDLYLRGKGELRKIWREPVRRAVELFAEAHQRAPGDATLLAAYARARARLWYYDGGAAEAHGARELAERALGVAPERGESWLALASVRFVEQDLAAASRLLAQALARAPQLAEAHELGAEISLEVHDLELALERYRAALALDPELRCRFHMARIHAYAGRWDEVDALERIPVEDEQTHSLKAASRARLALWSPDAKQRVRGLVAPESAEDLLPVLYTRACLSVIESGTLSEQVLEFMSSQFMQRDQAPRFAAFKHMLATEIVSFAGDLPHAVRQLESAVAAGLSDQNWIERCPVLGPLRQLGEFERLSAVVRERAEHVRKA